MAPAFRLLYDQREPLRTGELDPAALASLYGHPPGADGAAWLRTNFVASVDGAISGPDGRSGSINTRSDQHVFALHRALADVILVGAETVRTEGYRAVDLQPWQRELRADLGLKPFPTLAIVTGSLNLDPAIVADDADHGPVTIITVPQDSERLRPFRDAGAHLVEIESSHSAAGRGNTVPLDWALASLITADERRVLCEGGPRLHRDLLAAGLVDELSLTLAPTVVGGESRRSTDGPALPEQVPFVLQHVVLGDDESVFLSYRRVGASR